MNILAGVLFIIPNYSGAKLNFGLAVERARKAGFNVSSYIVGDDCADTGAKQGGRRGMAGIVLVMKVRLQSSFGGKFFVEELIVVFFLYTGKIAGAMAEKGARIHDITDVLDEVTEQLGTVGVCLNPSSLPGKPALFYLGPDEIDLGTGIHGEAGVTRIGVGF